MIVSELKGENMDIVEWSEDPATYISNALNPAQVVDVIFNKDSNSCLVVVPDYQLSLAIGKRGQNVRLAAKLTGYKIDIKSESDMKKNVPADDEVFKSEELEYVDAMNKIEKEVEEVDESFVVEDIEEEVELVEETPFGVEYEVGELTSGEAEDQIMEAEERDPHNHDNE